jgi:hypothetical protein
MPGQDAVEVHFPLCRPWTRGSGGNDFQPGQKLSRLPSSLVIRGAHHDIIPGGKELVGFLQHGVRFAGTRGRAQENAERATRHAHILSASRRG